MATKAKKPTSGQSQLAKRTTERVNIWLPPDQLAWLKSKKNISETVRALITEAMNMENLVRSVGKPKKKRG